MQLWMLVRSFWQSCLHITWWWVSARLPAGDSSSFYVWPSINIMVHHFMCVGTIDNNSAIERKVVSKTVINCGCAFWYIFWSKPQTWKYILKHAEELDLPSSVFVNWLVSIYKSQTFIMWYMYIFLDIREEFVFRNSPITRQSNPLNG